MQDTRGQAHPLYAQDRATVDSLMAAAQPSSQNLVDAARLLNRYRGFPGAFDLTQDIVATATSWGYQGSEGLNAATRAIWSSGFRPELTSNAEVGSGSDVQAASAGSLN